MAQFESKLTELQTDGNQNVAKHFNDKITIIKTFKNVSQELILTFNQLTCK